MAWWSPPPPASRARCAAPSAATWSSSWAATRCGSCAGPSSPSIRRRSACRGVSSTTCRAVPPSPTRWCSWRRGRRSPSRRRGRRDALRVAYLAQGLMWRAGYTLVAPASGAGRATMTGAATIENPGAPGDRRRRGAAPRGGRAARDESPELRDGPHGARAGDGDGRARRGGQRRNPSARATSIPCPAPSDFVPGTSRTVALFAQAAPQVERSFAFRASGMGHLQQWRAPEQDLHAEVTYLVRRPAGTPFGDTPLPAGVVRVLVPDSAGRVQLPRRGAHRAHARRGAS